MQSRASAINSTTKYSTVCELFENEPEFLVIEEKARQKLFEEYMNQIRRLDQVRNFKTFTLFFILEYMVNKYINLNVKHSLL
jgi:hypothetical protein